MEKSKTEHERSGKDQFFVGPGSSLTIRFLTGEELVLQPNSMFAIQTRDSKLEINLLMGTAKVVAKVQTQESIRAPKKIIFVSDQPLQLAVEEVSSNFEIADSAPEISVTTTAVETVKIPEVASVVTSSPSEEVIPDDTPSAVAPETPAQ